MIALRRVMLLVVTTALFALAAAGASGPTSAREKDVFTVSGVKVDVSDKDAASAKLKAIRQAQVKAFRILVRRIASEEALAQLQGLDQKAIGRLMSSLSVEEEHTGPRRYIGRLTIRFIPDRVREVLNSAGAGFVEEQAPRILVVPVWNGPDGPVLWEDNPWRKAWTKLGAENALVPVLVPVGDLTDTQTISANEALEGDQVKLEALRLRYDAEGVLIAIAEPSGGNSLRAIMTGDSPVGRIDFDKTYIATEGGLETAAEQAARRFHAVMTYRWKEKMATTRAATAPARTTMRLIITVPFNSLREWQALRARLQTTPGVTGVDVSTLSGHGAVVTLGSALPLNQLRYALQQSRLLLQQTGGKWVLQAY